MATTTISNGVITTDTLNVRANTTTGTLSVSGNASVTGSLSVNGTDITATIAEQTAKIDAHIENMNTATAPHMTVAEHEQFNKIAQLFADMEPDNSHLGYTSIDIPTEAIPPNYFPVLFAEKAQDNYSLTTAPGDVFGSRVPLAYLDAYEQPINDWASVDEALDAGDSLYEDENGDALVTSKLWANEGLQHTCSTDTIENRDDYTGNGPNLTDRRWAFYWEYGNYVKDQYGIKHVTTIKGVPAGVSIQKSSTETFTTSEFDITHNTCVFGPTFWFACVEDRTLTLTVNDTQEAATQLWVISSRPWDDIGSDHELYDGIEYPGLSVGTKDALQSSGITADDWHIWPECLVKDANGNDKIRPYWCHSAFALGAYPGGSGLYSIAQLPLMNNLSFQQLNAMAADENGETYVASKCPGSATVNGFGVLFDIIKNATKNSQSIHSGYVSLPPAILEATAAYDNNGHPNDLDYYLFPANADASKLQRGMSIRLTTSRLSYSDVNYSMDETIQHARVKEVGKYNLATGLPDDDTGTMCIAVDKATGTANQLQPFVVYPPANPPDSLPENMCRCCYASQSLSMTGETMLGGEGGVLHKHDGAVYSFLQSEGQNLGKVGTHTYRVQGTEYSPGANICAADTVAVKGNGSTTVNINGVDYTPTSSQYVILQCKIGESRKLTSQSSNIADWAANDLYEPIAISPAAQGTVLNNVLTSTGVVCPTRIEAAGNPVGTGDFLYVGANPAEFLSGGDCSRGARAGSSFLNLTHTLGTRYWDFSARD